MSPPASAVAKVANLIRKDALAAEEGSLLGSEDALLERYGISRPTLRQAASLIAQEQLVTVKRGVGGGYFVRRPDSRAVSRMAAIYLKAHGARVSDVISAFVPIRIELARLAAHAPESELARLDTFLEREKGLVEPIHFRDFVLGERAFNLLLGELSGNQALSLFLQITLDLAAMVEREEDMYRGHPDRISEMRHERNRLARAIVDQDEELAVLAAQRCARMSMRWLKDDADHRQVQRPNDTANDFAEVVIH